MEALGAVTSALARLSLAVESSNQRWLLREVKTFCPRALLRKQKKSRCFNQMSFHGLIFIGNRNELACVCAMKLSWSRRLVLCEGAHLSSSDINAGPQLQQQSHLSLTLVSWTRALCVCVCVCVWGQKKGHQLREQKKKRVRHGCVRGLHDSLCIHVCVCV